MTAAAATAAARTQSRATMTRMRALMTAARALARAHHAVSAASCRLLRAAETRRRPTRAAAIVYIAMPRACIRFTVAWTRPTSTTLLRQTSTIRRHAHRRRLSGALRRAPSILIRARLFIRTICACTFVRAAPTRLLATLMLTPTRTTACACTLLKAAWTLRRPTMIRQRHSRLPARIQSSAAPTRPHETLQMTRRLARRLLLRSARMRQARLNSPDASMMCLAACRRPPSISTRVQHSTTARA